MAPDPETSPRTGSTGAGAASSGRRAGGFRDRWRASRVVGAAALAALLASACTTLSLSNVASIAHAIRAGDAEPTAEEVAAAPYYQLQASTAAGTAVLVLGNVDGSRELWYGAPPTLLAIEHGRVVRTAGLEQNLDALRPPDEDPFVRGLHRLDAPVSYRRVEDWSPGYRYGVAVDARLSPAGVETVEILGTPRRLLRIDERVESAAAGLAASNRYWVDPEDGFVWASEQTVAPGQSIRLVQLRPYRGAGQ
nr:YjbF family lipoprotein [Luteimonas salinisoli]